MLRDIKRNMREWRNWQTRTFEGRVVNTVRVQVPFLAPKQTAGSAVRKWAMPIENTVFISVFDGIALFFCLFRKAVILVRLQKKLQADGWRSSLYRRNTPEH